MYRYYVMMLTGLSMIFASPGDIIGYSIQDFMSVKQRIMVDDYDQAHIAWSDREEYSSYGMLTFRMDGSYYSCQCTNNWSGDLLLDITRDANPEMQRTILTYHYNPGSGYYSWIDIDGGNCWGFFPNDPQFLPDSNNLWPMVTAVLNGNITVATAGFDVDEHQIYLTTDEGTTWSQVLNFDSCATNSHFVRGSHNSSKMVFTHTRFITDSIAGGQLDNDVYYILSTDGGMNWGQYTNITGYQPDDTIRACGDICTCFDQNDNLHIVWSGRKVDSVYHWVSKIFHWDEVHDTITVVNSPSIYYNEPGGWWISNAATAVGLPVDHPQFVVDHNTNILYCLWHGNDDTTDVSGSGYMNGELYGAYSTDGGLTWSDYVNLTNTRSPGAGPGECESEGSMSANPFVVNDSIFITFVEDKDAGVYALGQGELTDNPVYCWVFSTSLIRTGVEEYGAKDAEDGLRIFPVPFFRMLNIYPSQGVTYIRIYDAAGRLKKDFPRCSSRSLIWYGDDDSGRALAPGVYFIRVSTDTGEISTKVVKMR